MNRRILLLVGLLTIAAMPARAQLGYTASSLEAMVAQAPVIVRASVAEVQRDAPEEQVAWFTLTLKVRETLKGEKRDTLKLANHTLASYGDVYQQWRDRGRELLWFLSANPDYRRDEAHDDGPPGSRYPLQISRVMRLEAPVPAESGYVSLPPPVFTMDFAILQEPGALLRAARGAASDPALKGDVRIHSFNIPRSVMQRSGYSGDANTLSVPVVPRLEAVARRLITTPREFLPEFPTPPKDDAERREWEAWRSGDADQMRLAGIDAMRYFKSPENIRLLTRLLRDPAFWLVTPPDRSGIEEREYFIRKQAVTVLRGWDVPVKEPVLRERVVPADAGTGHDDWRGANGARARGGGHPAGHQRSDGIYPVGRDSSRRPLPHRTHAPRDATGSRHAHCGGIGPGAGGLTPVPNSGNRSITLPTSLVPTTYPIPDSHRLFARPVRPIRTETGYDAALGEIEALFDACSGTPEADRLDVLTTLVEAYEREHHPIEPPSPIETLLYQIESRGLSRSDLEPYLGSRARVSETLNRRRALTIEMIRRLHDGLGIPAEVLIRPYPLRSAA